MAIAPIDQMILEIESLDSLEDGEPDLARLQVLADAFFSSPECADHLSVWFRLYERFPGIDNGVFWSILHGLETHSTCDRLVVESVQRHPTPFPTLMVNRMLNAGISSVDDVSLIGLLEAVASNADASSEVRRDALAFLARARRIEANPAIL
jgi:hypothetical protein